MAKYVLIFLCFFSLQVQAQTDELAGHYFVGNMVLWWMEEKIEFFENSTFEYTVAGEAFHECEGTYKIDNDVVYLKYTNCVVVDDTIITKEDALEKYRPKKFFYKQNRLEVEEDHYGMKTKEDYDEEMALLNKKLREEYHLDKDNYERYFWRKGKPMRIDFTKKKN